MDINELKKKCPNVPEHLLESLKKLDSTQAALLGVAIFLGAAHKLDRPQHNDIINLCMEYLVAIGQLETIKILIKHPVPSAHLPMMGLELATDLDKMRKKLGVYTLLLKDVMKPNG